MAAERQMRIGLCDSGELSDENLTFARQLGLTSVRSGTPWKWLPGDKQWEYEDLLRLRQRVESFGLTYEVIENVPQHFFDKVMLGLPGRDEQIEHYCTTIRNMGRAGIPMLGYHFMPSAVWRTSRTTPGRGGAHVTSFDMALVGQTARGRRSASSCRTPARRSTRCGRRCDTLTVSAEQMWENYAYFLHACPPGRRGGGRHASPSIPTIRPIASLGGHRPHLHLRRELQAGVRDEQRQPGMGARPLPRLLLRDARRRRQCPRDDRVLRPQGAHLLHPLPRCAGHRAQLRGVLHRRGELRRGGDDAAA